MVSQFHHQTYRAEPPASPHQWLVAQRGPEIGCAEYQQRMAAVGRALRAAGVAAIYLVNGTFVGNDAVGFIAELSRVASALGDDLRQVAGRTMPW